MLVTVPSEILNCRYEIIFYFPIDTLVSSFAEHSVLFIFLLVLSLLLTKVWGCNLLNCIVSFEMDFNNRGLYYKYKV